MTTGAPTLSRAKSHPHRMTSRRQSGQIAGRATLAGDTILSIHIYTSPKKRSTCSQTKKARAKPTSYEWALSHRAWNKQMHALHGNGLKVISKNVDGYTNGFYSAMTQIRNEHKRNPLLAVCIQEHQLKKEKAAKQKIRGIARGFGLLYIQADRPEDDTKGGVAIVIPHSSIELMPGETNTDDAIARILRSVQKTPDGRLLTADTLVGGTRLRIASVYAPQSGRTNFYESIEPLLDENTLMGIDANCVLDTDLDLDRNAKTEYTNNGAEAYASVLAKLDLTDVAREHLGEGRMYTNITHTPTGITRTRIDHIHVPTIDGMIWNHNGTNGLLDKGTGWGHRAVEVELRQVTQERGQDLARVSVEIFDDQAVLELLRSTIEKVMAKSRAEGVTWGQSWVATKDALLPICTEATAKLRTKIKRETATLTAKIKYLETQVTSGNAKLADVLKIKELNAKLRTQRKEDRSLRQMIEKDAWAKGQSHDANTAAFHRRWTPRNAAQWVDSLESADWSDLANPIHEGMEEDATRMAETFRRYYQPLYSKKPAHEVSVKAALRTLEEGDRVLPPTAEKCDADIQEDEILLASAHLPTNKSPGPDRIPNEMYTKLSKVITPILTKVFNEARGTQEGLPPRMLEGITTLLYKKGNRSDPRNYRPITLLNNDYKLMMRVLTKRMNEAVVQFVSSSQNGFVPDSFLQENLVRLQLVQQYIEQEDEEAMLIFADMEKAFDRCSWDFIKRGMHALGFGDGFINFINLAYSEDNPPTRQMYVNGYLSRPFPLGAGIAQGCPISPLLFLVIAEPLSRLINTNVNIEGVVINGVSHKLAQFADDSTFINRPSDLSPTLAMIKIWCRATSMLENAKKREVLLLGKLKRTFHRYPNLRARLSVEPAKDGETIRVLGIPMGNDFDLEKWWMNRYTVVKKRMAAWGALGSVSLVGRSILEQAIVWGSVRFWFFALIVPEAVLKLLEKDVKELLWKSSPKLKANEEGTANSSNRYMTKEASHLPRKAGGGGIIHIQSHITAFQAQWIIKYLDPRRAPWKTILDHWLLEPKTKRGRAIVLIQDEGTLLAKLPEGATYMRACITAFKKLGLQQDIQLLDHESQGELLWDNNRFTIDLPPSTVEAWCDHMDTYRLSDMLDDNGQPFTPHNWGAFSQQYAPKRNANGDRLAEEEISDWIYDRELDLPVINMNVMKTVRKMELQTTMDEGEIVAVTNAKNDSVTEYAKYHIEDMGRDLGTDQTTRASLEMLQLDLSGYPHATGEVRKLRRSDKLEKVSMWWSLNKHFSEPLRGEEDIYDQEEERGAIIGPVTSTFPRNAGWYMEGRSKVNEHEGLMRLSDHTIHVMTVALTEINVTAGVRPNCEENWRITTTLEKI